MFLGLGHPSLVSGHHEQGDVDGFDAGEHVLEVSLVTGNVDKRHFGPSWEDCPGEPEVDGEPPLFLFVPAVRVPSGDPLDECRLAVVDVTGGADQRH